MKIPEMLKIKLKFNKECVVDLRSKVMYEINKSNLLSKIKPNDKVGITVGSRSINSLNIILETLIEEIRKYDAKPFILAAMGSHGGGTAIGQLQVLDSLGINKQNFDVPIIAETNTTVIGYLKSGMPVHCLNHALKMDKLIILNRIKPHTSFKGEIESGLFKMLTIGLGGPTGAKYAHGNNTNNMSQVIIETGNYLLSTLPVIMGIGLIENAYKEIYKIEILSPRQMLLGEKVLLKTAKDILPKIPFEEIDVLICEEMGKCFSGTGMDTNIIGRLRTNNGFYNNKPNIKRIVVLDLAQASQGNANGIGLADFVTRRLVDKIDFDATYLNCLTTGFLQRAMLPIIMKNDKDAIITALKSLDSISREKPKIVRIKNTLDLENIWISKELFLKYNNLNYEIDGSWQNLIFTKDGRLITS